jgi:hypothetical protein
MGYNEPAEKPSSGSKTEQLIDETGFARRTRILEDAVTAADHPHDFETFDRGVGCLHPLEATRWPDHPLERAMIRLNNVVQEFRCPVPDMPG